MTSIIPIGQKIRKYKIDELTQLFNVLIGNMSLVGPRPNVKSEVDLYTEIEKELLSVKPGITDFSSIVFSDEGKILENKENPDLSYNQLIRPWKSRLGLIYKTPVNLIRFRAYDFYLVALISKPKALKWVVKKLEKFNVDQKIIDVAKRDKELFLFLLQDQIKSLKKKFFNYFKNFKFCLLQSVKLSTSLQQYCKGND